MAFITYIFLFETSGEWFSGLFMFFGFVENFSCGRDDQGEKARAVPILIATSWHVHMTDIPWHHCVTHAKSHCKVSIIQIFLIRVLPKSIFVLLHNWISPDPVSGRNTNRFHLKFLTTHCEILSWAFLWDLSKLSIDSISKQKMEWLKRQNAGKYWKRVLLNILIFILI